MSSPLRKGPASAQTNKVFAVAREDAPLVFAPLTTLDEVISADMHEFWEVKPFIQFPCIGTGCPACEAGNKPKYKSFMLVLQQGETEPKIMPMGITIERAIAAIAEEIGNIRGKLMKIKREGSGFSTKYNVIPLGKAIDVDKVAMTLNIEDHITIYDRTQIAKKLVEIGASSDDPAVTPGAVAPGAVAEEKAPTEKKAPKTDKGSAAPAADASLWDDA